MRADPTDPAEPVATSSFPSIEQRNPADGYVADALAVGVGPAGRTMATLLAQRHRQRRRLADKMQQTRCRIGGSPLPMSLPIRCGLGVREPVAAIVGHFRGLSRGPVDDAGNPINCRLARRSVVPARVDAG